MNKLFGVCFLSCFFFPLSVSQVTSFPYRENFDSGTTLPSGWQATSNRLMTGDFFVTTTSPHSAPHAVQSTNSVVSQSLISPVFVFSGRRPGTMQFFISRSGTHTSPLLVEASVDGGSTFTDTLGDTLFNPGTSSYRQIFVTLPPFLSEYPFVRFRWRVLGGSGGTTGTLRLDDIIITTVPAVDLAVDRVTVTPSAPHPLTPLSVTVTLNNIGLVSASGYSVDLSLLTTKEPPGVRRKIATLSGPELSPGDSLRLEAFLDPLPMGNYRIDAVLMYSGDERPDNDSASVSVTVGAAPRAIVINEVMYAPAGDEPEWIELHNPTSDTLDLMGWRVSDKNTAAATLVSLNEFRVAPGEYGLIVRDSLFFSLRPGTNAPARVVNFAALNNTTDDAVVLFDNRLVVIDSVHYFPAWGGQGGRSLERIDVHLPSTDASTWGTSVDSTGATAGARNSIARLDRDLVLAAVNGRQTAITIEVQNAGREVVEQFGVYFWEMNPDGTLIDSVNFHGVLPSGSSIILNHDWRGAPPGETKLRALIHFPPDQRPGNNSAVFSLVNPFPSQELVVNEIMYEPLSGQNEWIELFHRGTSPVDLAGWSIRDRATASGSHTILRLGSTSRTILPGEFVVVAAESTILNLFPSLVHAAHVIVLDTPGGFSLGNDGDDVVFVDLAGAVIDTVRYDPSWHHPDVIDTRGRSLERIHPDFDGNIRSSWSTSANTVGGSPGSRNTIYAERRVSATRLAFSPNPFSPDGDGHEDHCIIHYALPFVTATIRVRIFDVHGRLVNTLADGEISGATGELVWDGFDADRRRARIGPYIVLLEGVRSDGGEFSARGVVVVATQLNP